MPSNVNIQKIEQKVEEVVEAAEKIEQIIVNEIVPVVENLVTELKE